MLSLEFKVAVFEACLAKLDEKLAGLTTQHKALQQDLLSATKSSAGDKHETGRAMLQLEMEKLGKQHQLLEEQKNRLLKVPYTKAQSQVVSGALVQIDNQLYFVSIGLGEVEVKEQPVFCLAPTAPLAQAFLCKAQGITVTFNGVHKELQELV